MTKNKLNTPQGLIDSKYSKKILKLKKICTKLYNNLQIRNAYVKQTQLFMTDMLKQGKIQKEDLIPYFKKRKEKL